MKRTLILLFLLAAALVVAFRAIGHSSLGGNGSFAAWLPIPEGAVLTGGTYDRADADFNANRGNASFRSSRTIAELRRFYQDWLEREGFAAVDGMHRVIVTELTTSAFALYACHRSKGRFLNIVGSEQSTSTGSYIGVALVYWESRELAFVEDLFGLKSGERPCAT